MGGTLEECLDLQNLTCHHEKRGGKPARSDKGVDLEVLSPAGGQPAVSLANWLGTN